MDEDEVDLSAIDVRFSEGDECYLLFHRNCSHPDDFITSIEDGDTIASLINEIQQHFKP